MSRKPESLLRAKVRKALVARGGLVLGQPGSMLTEHGRSDFIGCDSGRFFACEVKTPTGSVDPAQRVFIREVRRAGGIGYVARSPEQATHILDLYKGRLMATEAPIEAGDLDLDFGDLFETSPAPAARGKPPTTQPDFSGIAVAPPPPPPPVERTVIGELITDDEDVTSEAPDEASTDAVADIGQTVWAVPDEEVTLVTVYQALVRLTVAVERMAAMTLKIADARLTQATPAAPATRGRSRAAKSS